jgi:hypothetical protein
VPIRRGVENVEAARKALLRRISKVEDELDELRIDIGDFVRLAMGGAP